MTEDEARTTMERYGITAVHRTFYRYQEFNYGSLVDALRYAELVTSRADQRVALERNEDERSRRA